LIRPGRAALGLAVAAALGCGDAEAPRSTAAPTSAEAPADAEESAGGGMEAPAADSPSRAEALGPFLDAHWALPVPAQGPAPEGFSPLEASLDPASCGACHPEQLADWQTSLHADAYSPGFAGQLIEGSLASPDQQRNCQTCHTPLEEQQLAGADGASPHGDPALRQAGLICAACHVRAHERFGPPRREDAPVPPGPLPHAGFSARAEYQESRFCGPCHQFYDREGPSGKPIQNTNAEWEQSPHAARGETCQSCHMPDRAHLWRGIHDEAMVRGAVDVALEDERLDGPELEATLRLTSHGVGHAFPTYVTPRVLLRLYQADAEGEELPGTRAEHVIGRQVDFGEWKDVFDTRVPPEGSAVLRYAEPRSDEARSLIARVVVDPDAHYRGVFAGLLPTLQNAEARRLIGLAFERASASSYVLEELRRPLP